MKSCTSLLEALETLQAAGYSEHFWFKENHWFGETGVLLDPAENYTLIVYDEYTDQRIIVYGIEAMGKKGVGII